MIKNYYLLSFFIIVFFCFSGYSQELSGITPPEHKIEFLSIYPNPVPSSRPYIYIKTNSKAPKNVEFFNVLGKLVYAVRLTDTEINVSELSKGIYIVKVTENNQSITRKLIVK